VTAETRRFTFCFVASFLINAAALLIVAWTWRPFDTPLPISHPRIKLVTLVLHPPIVPKITPPLPKKPPTPKKRRRPGTRVHSTQPAPLAAPAGGAEAGSPAPAQVAPHLVTTERPAQRVVHNVFETPVPLPLPVSAAVSVPVPPPPLPIITKPPIITQPTIVTGQGIGASRIGKGTGAGDGTGQGSGAGTGKSRDAGEPFGLGAGLAGDGAPRHVVYVLDLSGSMTSRIKRAKEELRHALNSLRSDETFNLVIFSDEARSFAPHLVPATPEQMRQADQFLGMLQVGGGTNLEDAMTQALSLPDVNEVIVLTDGVPTEGETDFTKLARLIRERNHTHARISAVGLVGKNPDGTDDSFAAAQLLEEIARQSGGTAKVVPLGVATPE
jgi:hypothetical protein